MLGKMYSTFRLVIAIAVTIGTASGQVDVGLELQRLSTKVDDLGDDLEDGLENVGNELDNVGNEIDVLEDEVGDVEDGLDDVEDKIDNLKAEVQSLRSELESGLADLKTSLEAEITNGLIKAKMETIQEELQHQIDTFQNTTLHVLQELKAQSSCPSLEQEVVTIATQLTSSCGALAKLHVGIPSGYYLMSSSTGSAVSVYCDMERQCCGSTGGWMRVAYLDMTDPSQQCPSGFSLRTSPKRVCERTVSPGCTSITFPAHGVQYSRVCGQVRAYQESGPNGFGPYYNVPSVTIDGSYVDGISVTHGRSPRKHIWTFAATIDEVHTDHSVCPCSKVDAPYTGQVPPFIGTDYFCETGSREYVRSRMFYHDDPLWDGEGCGPTSTCCQFNSPPWFCKELPQPTTDNIELRICCNASNEDIPFDLIELYVQ